MMGVRSGGGSWEGSDRTIEPGIPADLKIIRELEQDPTNYEFITCGPRNPKNQTIVIINEEDRKEEQRTSCEATHPSLLRKTLRSVLSAGQISGGRGGGILGGPARCAAVSRVQLCDDDPTKGSRDVDEILGELRQESMLVLRSHLFPVPDRVSNLCAGVLREGVRSRGGEDRGGRCLLRAMVGLRMVVGIRIDGLQLHRPHEVLIPIPLREEPLPEEELLRRRMKRNLTTFRFPDRSSQIFRCERLLLSER